MENGQELSISTPRRPLSNLLCVLLAGQPLLPATGAGVSAATGNTQIGQAANGVPVVNIATPNQSGISHNQYHDFNVGKDGLILNNSAGHSQSQLGGLIQSNANLQKGKEAQGIINEVVSPNRSELRGYLEVAGKKASVMVANPYGITCDGCGFINTPNVTLTTGKPVSGLDGQLQSLEVRQGIIQVQGKGLNAGESDKFTLIARAAEINASLHANDVGIILGSNRVASDGTITPIAGKGDVPAVAIDTGALGGMYANRIRLVSNDSGVGVNLGNLNTRQGDIRLDSSGKLILHNAQAQGALHLKANEVALTGNNKAAGAVQVQAEKQLHNAGKLQAAGDMQLLANSIVNAGGDIGAGDNLWLQKDQTGNASREIVNRSGSIVTTRGDITMKTRHLKNERAGLEVEMEVEVGGDRWRYHDGEYVKIAEASESGTVKLPPPVGKEDRVIAVASSVIKVNGAGAEGRISAGRDLHVMADRLDNAASTLSAGRDAWLSGNSLSNLSWLEGTETRYRLLTDYGMAIDTVTLNAERQTNELYTTQQDSTSYVGSILAGNMLNAQFSGAIHNTTWRANAGRAMSTGYLGFDNINALSFQLDAQRQRLPQHDSALSPLSGSALAGNQVNLQAQNVVNSSSILSAREALSISTVGEIENQSSGVVVSAGALNLTAGGDISNRGALVEGEQVELVSLGGNIFNEAVAGEMNGYLPRSPFDGYIEEKLIWWESEVGDVGSLVGSSSLNLQAAQYIQVTGGEITSGGALTLKAGEKVDIESMERTNRLGYIGYEFETEMEVNISTRYGSRLRAGGDLWITAGENFYIESSRLQADGDMHLAAARSLHLYDIENKDCYDRRPDSWHLDSIWGYDERSVETSLKSGGDMVLQAGMNIFGQMVNIDAARSLQLLAKEEISLDAGIWSKNESRWSGKQHSRKENYDYSYSQLSSGGDTTLRAGSDLLLSGVYLNATGRMQLDAGQDIRLDAVSDDWSEKMSTGTYRFNESIESLGKGGVLITGIHILLDAGQDILTQAAGMVAQQDIRLKAGRDISLQAFELTHTKESYGKNKQREDIAVRQVGSELSSGRAIALEAGQDILLSAARLTAGGEVGLESGRDITLQSATDSDYYFFEESDVDHGLLSKTVRYVVEEDYMTLEQGSLLSGDWLTVSAGKNLSVSGSGLVGTRRVWLEAGNDLAITAATEEMSSYRLVKIKEQGLLSGGLLGFTIGSRSSKHKIDEQGITQSHSISTVGSGEGSVFLDALGRTTLTGADVVAAGLLSVNGDSVHIIPGQDMHQRDERLERRSSGLTIALSGSIVSAINSAVNIFQRLGKVNEGRLGGLQGLKAVLSGVQSVQTLVREEQAREGDAMIGLNLSLGTQKSVAEWHESSLLVHGSTLTSGGDLVMDTFAQGSAIDSGNIMIVGSQLKSGGDMWLWADNNLLLSGAANTRESRHKNSSSGASLGVGINFGGSTAGLTVSASANYGKGHEDGNSTIWTETVLDSGNQLEMNSGRNMALVGAQIGGKNVVLNAGGNLEMTSLRDSDRYDARQFEIYGGLSVAVIGAGWSGNIGAEKDKTHSVYDSVQEQTGVFAGEEGFRVTVGGHTQLNGAVLASTASTENNWLKSGTLGWTDIINEAEFESEHLGGSIGTSGGSLNVTQNDGSAKGITRAAMSGGSVEIADTAGQQRDIATLSRDVEQANGTISPIFDKEKERKRLQQARLLGDIGAQISDIVRTQGGIYGEQAARDPQALAVAKAELEAQGKPVTDETVAQQAYNNAMQRYGTGGDYQQATQAITVVLQGLADGNIGKALAGGMNPYVAEMIHSQTAGNEGAQALAHLIWGALSAELSGERGVAGATGAVTGEIAAQSIMQALYPGRKPDELTESEKQKVSTLSMLTAGLAGGVSSGSTAGAVTGAVAGKNAVENNFLLPAAPVVPVAPPAGGNGEVNPGNGCNGASVCVMTKPDGSVEETPPFTDGPSIVEARDEAAKARDPNVAKELSDAEKAELGGAGSGTPGGWEPQDEENARNQESQVSNSEKLSWESWQNYPKKTIDGRQYAQIGDRLYSQHAVDRMQPSGLGSPAGTSGPGRNITPNMVEHVIKNGSPQNSVVNGVTRTTYWSGDVGVVTENNGNVIVTVLRRSGQ